jgi:hypothetical protein
LQHVEQLRQLIERGVAQQRTEPGHPWIVPRRLAAGAGAGAGLLPHGAELQHAEAVAVQTDALLAEHRRTWAGQANRGSNQ